ncbi:MAG: hypothetical protein IJ721_01195 [Bacteroidales bacterium]|nr:hypothetical protein [Bacteroidales bacterium]
MKKYGMTFAALAAILAGCTKENDTVQETVPADGVAYLTARFAPETKTAFVDGEARYVWKSGDNLSVHILKEDGTHATTALTYTGDDTDGEAKFYRAPENTPGTVVVGKTGFAVYPAVGVSMSEDNLVIGLKNTYGGATGTNFFVGNVEAPMFAAVESTTDITLSHLGGLLKVTYQNIPPKVTRMVVSAPGYQVSGNIPLAAGWNAEGVTGEQPYIQAVAGSGSVTLNFATTKLTHAQRVEGVSFYVPLPVGPGDDHKYPELDIELRFADGTTVPGSAVAAKDVPIERATVKTLKPIKMKTYAVSTLASGMAYTLHNMDLVSDDMLVVACEQYHLQYVSTADGAMVGTVDGSGQFQYPYGVCVHDGNIHIANKVGTGVNGLLTYSMSEEKMVATATGFNQAMQVKYFGDDAYLLARGDGSNAGVIYIYKGGIESGTREVYADFSEVTLSAGKAWPVSMAQDKDGSLVVFVSTSSGTPKEAFKLYRISGQGATPVAIFGSGTKATDFNGIVDGGSAASTFAANMWDMVFDAQWNLYLANGIVVRKLVRGTDGLEDGTLVTLCSNGYADGIGAAAAFNNPAGLAFNGDYSILYISENSNKRIRKMVIE